MYESILFTAGNGVATITLNRPEAMNAMNHKMVEELREALTVSGGDQAVRAVVITGAGKMFSAGGDVKWMNSAQNEHWETNFRSLVRSLHSLILSIRNIPKPVIAAVNGFASGAGFSLALACDIRIASDQAKFNQAYVKIGLTPDGGSSYFLSRMLGAARATDLIFTARVVDAGEALALGIVNQVIPAGVFGEEINKIAGMVASGPTTALAKAKTLINRAVLNELEAHLQLEEDEIVSASLSGDFKEGIKAFFEKRAPRFTGK